MAYRLEDLAEQTGTKLIGDSSVRIEGIGSLDKATSGQITFLTDRRYRDRLERTRASAVLLRSDDKDFCKLPMLVGDNPYLAFAVLSQLFWRRPSPQPGVHPSAVVAADARLGKGVVVGPGAVVAAGVEIGAGCVIGANCNVGEACTLGENCRLSANVTLEHDVHLGNEVLIHPGVVVGADGFGFAEDRGAWVKILQHGRVVIGDRVEIGANTTIDRGAIDDTVIEEGVKIDNQVQIAHNVRIGAHTAIAGCTGIAGSTTIGRYCRIGGAAGIGDHITICDKVTIAGMASVNASIREPGFYASSPPLEPYRDWLKNSARFKRLDSVAKRLRRLEQAAIIRRKDGKRS